MYIVQVGLVHGQGGQFSWTRGVVHRRRGLSMDKGVAVHGQWVLSIGKVDIVHRQGVLFMDKGVVHGLRGCL